MQEVETLARWWKAARRAVVLTGAGLSTASGIPDFRSPGGRWERYQPVPLPDFLASAAARERYWRYKGETWQVISAARPNAAHEALAVLGRADRIHLLVTQNVDGLHERSAFPPERLVNIHGTDSEVECMACHRRAPRAVAQDAWEQGIAVPCCACGGPWKPATISFGQQLVAADLERALQAAGSCDLFVALGT
ncbi:MAG TPA: Sir2 family NAD-dependent protein deacetylase, partial [Candidatus Binatus sp.]|nr:Sir2 family NAD-dependent protein deacetylase [Candidatus Binatus sp.]